MTRLGRLSVSSVLVALLLFGSGITVYAQDASSHGSPLSVTLRPGETKTAKLILPNKPNNDYEVAYLELTGSLEMQEAPTTISSCRGILTIYNGVGNPLWRWDSTEVYDYHDLLVWPQYNSSTPSTFQFGWAYDHSGLSQQGWGSTAAVVTSTGYFTYFGGFQRSYGEIEFYLNGSGNCSIYSATGNW
ncbi:MAG TPA: hypothetical protein VFO38_00155 [Candidatus Saccharimonadales bacterium]|nr:hypothetical protein [Candidatus Saccharimonadales bacterium]